MTRSSRLRSIVLLSLVTLVATLAWAPVAGATGQSNQGSKPLPDKAILFAADGMRPDLVERYAARA